MDEREEQRKRLELELQWVLFRQKALESIEEKLIQIKELVIEVNQGSHNEIEIEAYNNRIKFLQDEVKELDSESMKVEYRVIKNE